MITVAQAKALKPGDILYVACKGSAEWFAEPKRVVSNAKAFKRQPDKVEFQIKHPTHANTTIKECHLYMFFLTAAEALAQGTN
jgi:hypothetical protein